MLISLWNKLYANAFNKGNPAHVDRMSISERAIKISELQMRLDRIENDREIPTQWVYRKCWMTCGHNYTATTGGRTFQTRAVLGKGRPESLCGYPMIM